MSLGRLTGRHGSVRDREKPKRASVVIVPPVVKRTSKCRSFHFRYLELCRAKNLTPVPEIRSKSNGTTFLELYGDKLGVNEWLLIIEALHYDQVLQSLTVRMRRCQSHNDAIEPIDNEKRARLFRQKPVIYTRFIFGSLVDAISNCVESNKNLSVLKLEGLPLRDNYIESIAKALAANECLKEVSFNKSFIGDKGCETVCSTVKYLNRVEKFDISECNITSKGAEFVADMIKMQKITRFTEGWEKSLRYRSVDVHSISGLRMIMLANNPGIGDEGVKHIAEVLKEDAWVHTIDMEGCGLTDRGANIILDCLDLNNAIIEFNVRNNDGISKFLQRNIRDHLGKEDEDKLQEPQYDLSGINGLHSLPKSKKYTVSQLLVHTKTLEEQLSFERTLRKKAEKLNEKLNHQLMSFENNLNSHNLADPKNMPNGYVIVRNESLQSIIKDSQNYRQSHFVKLVNSEVTSSGETTPRSEMVTLRKEEQQAEPLEEAESYPSEAETSSITQAGTVEEPRKLLQVRKVRSEMKYVESIVKDNAKKHESKSDHEFANERRFKLNPQVHFETDIGDSVMVTNNERKRYNEGGGDGDNQEYRYEQDIGDSGSQNCMKKWINSAAPVDSGIGDNAGKQHNIGQQNGRIGDGEGINSHRMSNSVEQQAQSKRRNSHKGTDDRLPVVPPTGHVAQYMSDLENKSASQSSKMRHKSKPALELNNGENRAEKSGGADRDAAPSSEGELHTVNDLKIDTYMDDNFIDFDYISIDSTVVNSDSDVEANSTLRRSAAKYMPMQVFVRRKSSHLSQDAAESNDDEDEEQLVSPRSAYMELQRKKKKQKNHCN